MLKKIILILIILTSFNSCLTTAETTSESIDIDSNLKNEITSIENWNFDFQYKNQVIETKKENNNIIETTIKDLGNSSIELELRDDIIYQLKNNYNISLYKETNSNFGSIKFHYTMMSAVSSIGYFRYSVRLFFYNQDEELLYETLLSDSIYGKDFNKIAKDASERIAVILR